MLFPIGRCFVLEQFIFVSAGCFHNREFDLSAGHARDFTRHLARLMRAMRKLEAENILPKRERPLQIRNGDAGVIRGNDAKRHISEKVRRGIEKINLRKSAKSADIYSVSAAITFSSIAIGVGSAVTSTVVRVGFGLPSPAKYSA